MALLEENAVALGVERTVFTDPLPAAFAERPELVEAIDLLEACTAAESLGCHRVVWPLVWTSETPGTTSTSVLLLVVMLSAYREATGSMRSRG